MQVSENNSIHKSLWINGYYTVPTRKIMELYNVL